MKNVNLITFDSYVVEKTFLTICIWVTDLEVCYKFDQFLLRPTKLN